VVVAGLTASPGPGASESPSASGLVQELKTPELAVARSSPGASTPGLEYWFGRSRWRRLDLSRI